MLKTNATLTFNTCQEWNAAYLVEDGGIRLHFLCKDPGPGQVSDYFIFLTDADLATATNQAQLRTLVGTKLNRALRATGIASKLDQFVGQSLTI